MKNKIIAISILLIAFVSACNSNDNPVNPASTSKLNGTWTENTVQSLDTLMISVSLKENKGIVSGSYNYNLVKVQIFGSTTITNTSSAINDDLTGTFSGSDVDISFGEFVFEGSLSGDASKITGNAKYIETFQNGGADTTSYAITLKK